jgi:hypothetical protein
METELVHERLAYAAQAEPLLPSLALGADEAGVLERILSNHLVELHSEIGHTDLYEFRQALKRDRLLVLGLIEKLRSLVLGPAVAD